MFAVHLHWFPVVGFVHLTDSPLRNIRAMVMPTVRLGLPVAARYGRVLRGEMISNLQSDHVVLARAMGVPERRILLRHVLRLSSFSLLTIFGLELVGMHTYLPSPVGAVRAVDGISLRIRRGEMLAIVDESGADKTICSALRLGARLSASAHSPLAVVPFGAGGIGTVGCAFARRCSSVSAQCLESSPLLSPTSANEPDHVTACWNPLVRSANAPRDRSRVSSEPQPEAGSVPGTAH